MDFPDDFEDAEALPEIVSCLMADADKVASDFGTSTGLGHLFMAYCASGGGARRIRGMNADPVSMRSSICDILLEASRSGNYTGSDRSLHTFLDACRRRSDDLQCDPADAAMMDTHPNGVILSLIARSASACAVTEAVMSAGGLGHLLPEVDDYDHVEEELDMLLERSFPEDPVVSDVFEDREAQVNRHGPDSLRGLWEGASGLRKPDRAPGPEAEAPEPAPAKPPKPTPPKRDNAGSNHLADNPVEALEKAIRRLSEMAETGLIDPVHGRDREIDHIISVIMRRKKSSIILHGEAGVGKTSIVEGLALALRKSGADPDLAKRPIYEISLSGLVAGSRFRGDFEGRIAEMIRRAGEENAILFIDEIHNIVGSGAGGSRSNDGANMLKPALARGDITIIGATTSREARVMRSDHALMRRFDMLHIREPSMDEAREILRRSAWGYTAHHKIVTAPGALDEIIRICAGYMPDRKFPDKAFDLLDMGSVVARERNAKELLPAHVGEAAMRIGVRLPGPPPEEVRKKLIRIDDDLEAPADVRSSIGRAARSAWIRGGRRGTMSAWGLASKESGTTVRLAGSLASIMDLPLRLVDLSGIREASGTGVLLGYPGRFEATDAPGELVEIGDGAPETVVLFQGADACHPEALRLIAEMCAGGCIQASDGRSVNLSGAWVLFDIRPDESGRIGFGDSRKDGLEHTMRKSLGETMASALTGSWDISGTQDNVRSSCLDSLFRDFSDYGVSITCNDEIRARVLERAPEDGPERERFLADIRETLCDHIMRFSMEGPVELSIRHDEVVLISA